MDLFELKEYKIHKYLLMATGMWPYDHRIRNIVIQIIVVIMLWSHAVPLLWNLSIEWGHDINVVFENVTYCLYISGIAAKYGNNVIFREKHISIYKKMYRDWTTLSNEKEKLILSRFTAIGKRLMVIFYVYNWSACIVFCTVVMYAPILDVILPLNESRAKVQLYQGMYPFDAKNHYYTIWSHTLITVMYFQGIAISVDTMYLRTVYHLCGKFAVVKFRLENLVETTKHKSTKADVVDTEHARLVDVIVEHIDALEFGSVIDSSFSISFLYLICISIVGLSTSSMLIIRALRAYDVFELIRSCSFAIGVIIHLFYLSVPGQRLLDESSIIFRSAYNNDWYTFSKQSKQMLRIIMLRCLRPCYLYAGGFYTMSMENCGITIKTSMSYITVLMSFQQ